MTTNSTPRTSAQAARQQLADDRLIWTAVISVINPRLNVGEYPTPQQVIREYPNRTSIKNIADDIFDLYDRMFPRNRLIHPLAHDGMLDADRIIPSIKRILKRDGKKSWAQLADERANEAGA
jgi:hypothetical protein